jgi:hypothetical protein
MCVTRFFLLAGWHERRSFPLSPKKEKKSNKAQQQGYGKKKKRQHKNQRERERLVGPTTVLDH